MSSEDARRVGGGERGARTVMTVPPSWGGTEALAIALPAHGAGSGATGAPACGMGGEKLDPERISARRAL